MPGRAALEIVADPLPLLLGADAIIDFSSPAASVALAGLAAQARIADVIGTTGLSDEDLDKIDCGGASRPDRALRQHERRRQPSRGADTAGGGRAGARFRHRDRRDASSDEGRCALRHGAPARRSGGRRPRRFAEGPFGAWPRRPDRRAPGGRYRLRVAARRHGRRRSQRHLRRRGRAGDVEPPCRGSRAVRPRRAQGRHVGEGTANPGFIRWRTCWGCREIAPPRHSLFQKSQL